MDDGDEYVSPLAERCEQCRRTLHSGEEQERGLCDRCYEIISREEDDDTGQAGKE